MSEVRSETRLAKIVLLVDPDITNGRPLNVVINHGSRQGVKVGDQFVVFGIGPHIADPDTGEDLGILERVRGRGEVVHVQEHLPNGAVLDQQSGSFAIPPHERHSDLAWPVFLPRPIWSRKSCLRKKKCRSTPCNLAISPNRSENHENHQRDTDGRG
jgi:hypothetical protein